MSARTPVFQDYTKVEKCVGAKIFPQRSKIWALRHSHDDADVLQAHQHRAFAFRSALSVLKARGES